MSQLYCAPQVSRFVRWNWSNSKQEKNVKKRNFLNTPRRHLTSELTRAAYRVGIIFALGSFVAHGLGATDDVTKTTCDTSTDIRRPTTAVETRMNEHSRSARCRISNRTDFVGQWKLVPLRSDGGPVTPSETRADGSTACFSFFPLSLSSLAFSRRPDVVVIFAARAVEPAKFNVFIHLLHSARYNTEDSTHTTVSGSVCNYLVCT